MELDEIRQELRQFVIHERGDDLSLEDVDDGMVAVVLNVNALFHGASNVHVEVDTPIGMVPVDSYHDAVRKLTTNAGPNDSFDVYANTDARADRVWVRIYRGGEIPEYLRTE